MALMRNPLCPFFSPSIALSPPPPNLLLLFVVLIACCASKLALLSPMEGRALCSMTILVKKCAFILYSSGRKLWVDVACRKKEEDLEARGSTGRNIAVVGQQQYFFLSFTRGQECQNKNTHDIGE